ncbi:MAG: hypothetical protein KDC57_19405 [Saprospiraceae bacterium]|nr:hypothetical protein [Saprospiraceae bacterium]
MPTCFPVSRDPVLQRLVWQAGPEIPPGTYLLDLAMDRGKAIRKLVLLK